jgi:D-glycero-D-manno-heptose 1,7-bisphosphate phosphatase
MPITPISRRAVFLDRDGTINVEIDFIHRVEDLQLLPNAAAGLVRMRDLGFELILTSNQSGIGRGIFSMEDMGRFNAALAEKIGEYGVALAAIYFSPFHPTEGLGEYRRPSPLRKPRPGMILQAAAEHNLDLSQSFAVGDRNSDVATGHAAGCWAVLLRTGTAGNDKLDHPVTPEYTADDLLDAASFIERASKEQQRQP